MDLNINEMHQAAHEVSEVLKSIANPVRLLLLCQLSQGEACVSELGMLTKIEQPTLSQQLGLLRETGLVATRREGRNIYYHIGDQKILDVMQLLFTLYCPTKIN